MHFVFLSLDLSPTIILALTVLWQISTTQVMPCTDLSTCQKVGMIFFGLQSLNLCLSLLLQFLKLFTVVALKIPRTSPNSPSVSKTKGQQFLSEPKGLFEAFPISAMLVWMISVGMWCALVLFVFFIKLMSSFLFFYLILNLEPFASQIQQLGNNKI